MHLSHALQLGELGKDQPDGVLHPLIRVLLDPGAEAGQAKAAITTESKVFSIIATGFVRFAKRKTRVRIHAVVDFRGAPAPQNLMAMQQQMDEIADYLATIDQKLDAVLRSQTNQVLARLDGVDLAIREGECFGLLGPNGAGKTTTIEILEGLTEPDSGDVRVLGMSWARESRRIRARLGIQLQETRLTGKQRVEEVVRLFRSFYPSGPTVDELLARVRLEEKRRAYVRDLSGGQKQRLSVVCALAGSPDILFLDEPTTGLDPQSRRALWGVCEAFRRDGGTILLTTHFMDEAERLADRVAIMDHGEILVQGPPSELVERLAGEHTIEVECTVPLDASALEALPSVRRGVEAGNRRYLTANEPHKAVPALMAVVESAGGALSWLSTHRATLDDVFLTLTGRQLRDD
jgi:ABC-2 type transport system ATP-binding protein